MTATADIDIDQLVFKGVELQSVGELDSASAIYSQVLGVNGSHPAALYSLAAISLNQGKHLEGLAYAERCLRAAPAASLAWYIHGVALKTMHRFDEALRNFDRALALDPKYIEALVEKAAIHHSAQDRVRTLEQLDRILAIDPSNACATATRAELVVAPPIEHGKVSDLTLHGLALQNAGKADEARAVFIQTLNEGGNHFVSLYSLAAISINQGRLEEGLAYGELCLKADPTSPYGWYIAGCALKACRRFEDALQYLGRALEMNPAYKEALVEKGIIFGELKNYIEALVQFNRILEIDPEHKLALVNLATCLTILKRDEEASPYFARLLALDPEHDYVLGSLTHCRLHSCNWTDFESNRNRIIQGVQEGKRACKPLAFLALSDSPKDQLECAQIFTEQAYPVKSERFWSGEKFNHQKIRVGYVSPDLREHPVGHLMAGVFEHHDKSKYEIYSFSLGIDDNSSLRNRFISASDRFIDVRGKSSREIAQIIRESEIDILVDLAGPTMDAQPDIFAFRPAPIQAYYLGYPGTSGAPYYDYILADRTVVPESDRSFYSEEVIYLPGCYLPTDSKLAIAERTPTRSEMNLPEEGFVFCSFNHDYKINPFSFDTWMRILKRVDNSVLWLMKLNNAAEENLRKEAERRGVSASRLIFATRVPSIEAHLARYRLADLFLDTYPYNAHTTATDAVRAGLPVVTVTGNSFQSRVATSILHSIGMPHLAKATFQEYEDFAVEMALSPAKHQQLKEELREKIARASIFDTALKTQHLEAAFAEMVAK